MNDVQEQVLIKYEGATVVEHTKNDLCYKVIFPLNAPYADAQQALLEIAQIIPEIAKQQNEYKEKFVAEYKAQLIADTEKPEVAS